MRAKIELGLLCVLLAGSYATKAPGLLEQGSAGGVPLVVGGVFYAGLIVMLVRRSRGAALFLGALASVSVVLQVSAWLWAESVRPGAEGASPWQLVAGLGSSLVGAVLALDLWRQWHAAAKAAATEAPAAEGPAP